MGVPTIGFNRAQWYYGLNLYRLRQAANTIYGQPGRSAAAYNQAGNIEITNEVLRVVAGDFAFWNVQMWTLTMVPNQFSYAFPVGIQAKRINSAFWQPNSQNTQNPPLGNIEIVMSEQMDRQNPIWRQGYSFGQPMSLVFETTQNLVYAWPIPTAAYSVQVEIYLREAQFTPVIYENGVAQPTYKTNGILLSRSIGSGLSGVAPNGSYATNGVVTFEQPHTVGVTLSTAATGSGVTVTFTNMLDEVGNQTTKTLLIPAGSTTAETTYRVSQISSISCTAQAATNITVGDFDQAAAGSQMVCDIPTNCLRAVALKMAERYAENDLNSDREAYFKAKYEIERGELLRSMSPVRNALEVIPSSFSNNTSGNLPVGSYL